MRAYLGTSFYARLLLHRSTCLYYLLKPIQTEKKLENLLKKYIKTTHRSMHKEGKEKVKNRRHEWGPNRGFNIGIINVRIKGNNVMLMAHCFEGTKTFRNANHS